MNLGERVDQFVVGRIVFPVSNYLLNRKNILSTYRKLMDTKRASVEALRELQFQKLCAVVRRAHASSPFYARRFRETGLVPADIQSLADFRRVPKLVRKDLAEHGAQLVDARFRASVAAADGRAQGHGSPIPFATFRRHRLIRNTSSGSTGTPTVFYENGSTTALSWAHELRLKQWFGLAPGAKEARMSATPTEYATLGKVARARERLWNQMVLPGYFLSDREYEICVQRIRNFQPRILWGPTPALTGLAQYVRRENLSLAGCFLGLVISRAAPLYTSDKKLLEDVFACPAANIYGTREVGHVAMTCPYGSMHLNEENYLVEIDHGGAHDEPWRTRRRRVRTGESPGHSAL
jgi:phenylacetate-CoA ligase